MNFFKSHAELGVAIGWDETVDRSDVLAIIDVLAKVEAPLQTLCNSPRQNEHNAKALAMLKDVKRRIGDVIDPELMAVNTDDAENTSSIPTRSM